MSSRKQSDTMGSDILKTPPKAMTFDVFGTVVDWRSTVTRRLTKDASKKASSSSSLPRLSTMTDEDWGKFAQEWRNSYSQFVQSFKPGETEWRDIDTHHHLSLIDLLKDWRLEGLYTDEEIKDLSLIWHFLDPWKDSSEGIQKLGRKFITSTLSNGNLSLLNDLQEYGNLGFQKMQSGEDFKAYKPHPSVYEGAAKALGLDISEVAMIAAHLNDLKAARTCGMKTIYVEREQEEKWNPDEKEYKEAREWVDLWISQEEDGFREVARRFGIE
jgi:2-haloacid dehalogenase